MQPMKYPAPLQPTTTESMTLPSAGLLPSPKPPRRSLNGAANLSMTITTRKRFLIWMVNRHLLNWSFLGR
jgi:hypothetical protein